MSAAPTAHARQQPSPRQENILTERAAPDPRAETAGNLTEQEAYTRMIALKEDARYAEGTEWTNSRPYSMQNSYDWPYGAGIGVTGGVGCAAFAFILSNAAFGALPATMRTSFAFSDVHTGVVIAEGNYNKTIHWGRTLTRAEVESAAALVTRYPGGQPMPDGSSPNDPIDANAQGTLAGGLTWKLAKSGTLTISGAGAMPDYDSSQSAPWSGYLDSILNIVIANGVTRVGNNAFYGSKAFSVTIADSVTAIGDQALLP